MEERTGAEVGLKSLQVEPYIYECNSTELLKWRPSKIVKHLQLLQLQS